MITIAEVLKDYIAQSPLLEHSMAQGIINYSALARQLKPMLEKKLFKDLSESAIMMALKRMSPEILKKEDLLKSNKVSGDLAVRSNLVEYTFLNSTTLLKKLNQLINEIKEEGRFLTFTQGMFEVTVIATSELEPFIDKIFLEERSVAKFINLSAITMKLSPESVNLPGIHYSILKQVAWRGINVVEVVSTYREFTIILKKEDVDTTFSLLMNYLS